jgi:N utilization substance protein A
VAKALQPAKVKEVRIHEDTGTAEVIVPDYQLSLAIGKEGQNARLAARLTGWRVDIKSESQLAEEESYQNADEWAQGEWVVDPETGEQVWIDAEGGEAVSADAWAAGAEGDGDGEAAEATEGGEGGAGEGASAEVAEADATDGGAGPDAEPEPDAEPVDDGSGDPGDATDEAIEAPAEDPAEGADTDEAGDPS